MLVKYPIMGLSYARGLFAICGGGGSLKSGIKNTVDVYQLSESDPSGFSKEMTVETGTELASGVAFSHDGSLIAVSVSAACWVFEIDAKSKCLTLLVKFRTDFAEHESSQSAACFVGNSTVLTGGEDGVVRVWSLKRAVSPADRASGTSPALSCSVPEHGHTEDASEAPAVGSIAVGTDATVTLTREYRGHTKRIRGIHVDLSHRNLVVSSSEDQSCHLWRLTEDAPIWAFSKDDALDLAFQRLPTKPLSGPRKHQFRCVQFANNGRTLYTVLTPARGDSILLKWVPESITQESTEQWRWVVDACAIAGDKPVASLCVSQDDKFVCTAAVSGDMKAFLASTLQPYKMLSQDQHTFAITGMSFVPALDKNSPVCHVVSGGADKFLLRHDISLHGGEVAGGLALAASAAKRAIGGTVGLGLSTFMALLVLFILLLFIHAEAALLLDGPLEGFKDLSALRVDSPNSIATVLAVIASVVVPALISKRSSTTTLFLWNGLLCLLSGAVTFYAAVSPDLRFTWETGNSTFDELLDYKISIILGGLALAFLTAHALLARLL